MTATVVLAHPYPKSFNHAIYHLIVDELNRAGVRVHAHDLYEEGFDPLLTRQELGIDETDDPVIIRYSKEIVESDYLFFVHPNWWGQPPAILKGYVDRVFRPPYAYDFIEGDGGGGLPIEKLGGKYGIVYNTSNTEEGRENDYFGDPLERIWKDCTFGFCGLHKFHRRMFRIVSESTPEERRGWLETVREDIHSILREPPETA